MKLLATADLHFNHPRSKALAIEVIDRINAEAFDVLLLVGDTATAEGDELEACLSRFTFSGPKLFVAGNHELWSRSGDSHQLFAEELPRRVRALGWHWLEGDPFVSGDVGIVGTVGWYDYSFAPAHLAIPHRFYAAKVSPGAAARLSEHNHLVEGADDVQEHHLEIVARWNDGRYARLGRSDEQFLAERLQDVRASLGRLDGARQVIAAVHHVPFREMLPPRRSNTWDFVWAYLGAEALGEAFLADPRISHVLCGHAHLPSEHEIGHLRAINIGSGYRQKRYVLLTLDGQSTAPRHEGISG